MYIGEGIEDEGQDPNPQGLQETITVNGVDYLIPKGLQQNTIAKIMYDLVTTITYGDYAKEEKSIPPPVIDGPDGYIIQE